MNSLRPSYAACHPLARFFGWAGLGFAAVNTVNDPSMMAAAGLCGWGLAVASRMAYDIRTAQMADLIATLEERGVKCVMEVPDE